MSRVELAPQVSEDLSRFVDNMARFDVPDPAIRTREILRALRVPDQNPLIGRPLADGRRELVIGRGSRGSVAIYEFITPFDVVVVVAIRSQREAGYAREA